MHSFGDKWFCGGHDISIAESYVYLGVTLTPNLTFNKHISTLKYRLVSQKRQAVLIGVRAGALSVRRAIFLWKQWVEPKYAYACGMWIQPHDDSATGVINQCQAEGASAILGISGSNHAITDPPRCSLLREAGLHPAHVLHAAASCTKSAAASPHTAATA